MIDQVESLLKKAEEQKDELIELAKTLISFKTPAPPARNTDSIQT